MNTPKTTLRKTRRKNKDTVNYVDNDKLLQALIEWRKEGPDAPIPNYIGEAIMLICNNLATASNFANYSYNDEMRADALENCLLYIRNFDPEKSSNPFAYFTTTAYWACVRRIKKEQRQQYIKLKIAERFHQANMDDIHQNYDVYIDEKLHDNNYDFIEKYEKKNVPKKKVRAPKGLEEFMEKEE